MAYADQPKRMSSLYVFATSFPPYVVSTLCLLRRRVRLSRELSDDVVRARGYERRRVRGTNFDGDTLEEMSCFDNQEHGLTRGRFRTTGKLWWEIPLSAGKWNGIARYWHENGNLHFEMSYVNDLRHGRTRQWSADGNLVQECYYVDGRYRADGEISYI